MIITNNAIHTVVDRIASRKPCDSCGKELGEEYKLEKEPFQITPTRYCSDCK